MAKEKVEWQLVRGALAASAIVSPVLDQNYSKDSNFQILNISSFEPGSSATAPETKEILQTEEAFKLPLFELQPEGITALRKQHDYSPETTHFAAMNKVIKDTDGNLVIENRENIFAQDPEDLEMIEALLNQPEVQEIYNELSSSPDLQKSQLYWSAGVAGNKVTFCLFAAHFGPQDSFIKDRVWGISQAGVEELILLPGEIEQMVILEDPTDPNYRILQERGFDVSLEEAVLLGTRDIPDWPGSYEVESVLTPEGTQRLEAVVDGENYFLIPKPEISNETEEYQTKLSFPYMGYTMTILIRDVFVTTPNAQGVRFDERYVNLSAYIARLQRLNWVPEADTTIEFVSPEYFETNLADKPLRLVQILEDQNGVDAAVHYDDRVRDGKLTLYVVTGENSDNTKQTIKNRTLSSFITGYSLESLWAHQTNFTFRGNKALIELVDPIISLGITEEDLDPVQDLGVTYRGEYQDGTKIWNEYSASQNQPPYEILTPFPTPTQP